MPRFEYLVVVETDTKEHADEVMTERIGYDEDLGFKYTITSDESPGAPPF